MEVGYDLWRGIGDEGRDFFLPRMKGDFVGFYDVPASAGDMAILGRIIMAELKVPMIREDAEDEEDAQPEWRESTVPLLHAALHGGWTGHSERCTLPSIFAAMGVPKSERDPFGRWSPSGSDDYVRTYRALVRDLMERFRRMIASKDAMKIADDEDAIEEAV